MHRSLKPHAQTAQAKKVQPPTIPGDPAPLSPALGINHHLQHHQLIPLVPLYRLSSNGVGGGGGGGSISSSSNSSSSLTSRHLADDGISMSSSIVSSPSLEEGGFNLPRETSVALRMKDVDAASAVAAAGTASTGGTAGATVTTAGNSGGGGIILGGVTGAKANAAAGLQNNPLLAAAPPSIVPCPPAVFLREPLTHKAAVYYHQQLALQEDQGIDLTQSPGRDSPGSSSGSAGSGSRHSTASLDSGRASSYLTGVSGASLSRAPLSSPRCSSVSSCSIGSVDRQRNDELIIDWLMEMKYEEYGQLFIAAGYDLPTIARMTPEDLTAIGIKNPHHRERIKQRIDKLQVLDNLPHFVPGSIEEWLQLLRLEEYIQPLLDQNYKTVRDVTQVTWEDLEDIGIVKLGHQKKILLAIKRVKDIISGKWNPGGANAYQQQEYRSKPWQFNVPVPSTPSYVPTARVSWDDSKIYATTNGVVGTTPTLLNGNHHLQSHHQQQQQLHHHLNNNNNNNNNNSNNNNANADAYYCTGSNHECCNGNDVVLIKVRQPRGKSLESLEDIHDNSTRSHLTFSHYTTTDYGHFGHPSSAAAAAAVAAMQAQQHQQQQQAATNTLNNSMLHQQQQQQAAAAARLLGNPAAMAWRRSYDDGDITPTNDANTSRELMYEEGGGTLPRQQRGILQRAVLNTMPPLEHHYMNAAAAAEYVAHAGGVDGGGTSNVNAAYITGSPMTSKKIAPEPPRRHCSIRNSRALSSEGGGVGSPVTVQQQQVPGSGQQQQQHHQQQQQLYYGGANNMLPSNLHWQQQQAAAAAAAQQQPIYANYATIQQTTAEIHCEKYHDNKSNSSIDSIDTIPFANENTGTIKQRLLNRQDLNASTTSHHNSGSGSAGGGQHLHSSSSSSSSSSTNTIANITHSFHSLKSSSSLHDASLIRSDSIGSNASGGSGGGTAGTATSMLHLRSPTLQYPPPQETTSSSSCNVAEASPNNDAAATAASATAASATSNGNPMMNVVPPKVSVNVLNDIGNMLANLTDELDAMLEEEKRVGLNIDSE